MDDMGVGLVGELLMLQQAANEEWEAQTPQERGEAARDALRHMPGQAYLFEGDDDA